MLSRSSRALLSSLVAIAACADTESGSSSVASPRSTGRTAPSGSGLSSRSPVKARSRAPPTRLRSSVKTLEARSHFASFSGTSISMRALPSPASSIFCTRPTGKPEKVRSMPTVTPAPSSATSTRRCVRSKKPRAYRT